MFCDFFAIKQIIFFIFQTRSRASSCAAYWKRARRPRRGQQLQHPQANQQMYKSIIAKSFVEYLQIKCETQPLIF